MNRSLFYKIIAGIGIVVAALGGIYYYQHRQQQVTTVSAAPVTDSEISDLEVHRDLDDVMNLFKRDIYWLIAGSDDPIEYARFTIMTKSPDRDPAYTGKLVYKVARDTDGKFVGFIAYYLKNFYEGRVLFLAVSPDYRGKRWGERLMNYAIADLAVQGVKQVILNTWVNNNRSLKLYKRLGFVESYAQGNVVYLVKKLT